MFKKKYTNDFLDITVHSNSKRVHQLLDRYLDFRKPRGKSSRRIPVRVELREDPLRQLPRKSNAKDYEMGIIRGTVLQAPVGRSLVEAKVHFKTATIRSVIANYDEAHKEQILRFAFTLPLQRILAQHGLFFVHAAMVRCRDQNILICGPTGSGKSTLTLMLVRGGFDPLSDDDCFIKLAGKKVQLFPFATKAGLQKKLLAHYPAFSRHVIRDFRYYGKQRVSLNKVPLRGRTLHRQCSAVIFPRYRNKALSLKRISKHQAFKTLAQNSLVSLYHEKESTLLWTFYALAQQSPCYELAYHDRKLDAVAALIRARIAVPK